MWSGVKMVGPMINSGSLLIGGVVGWLVGRWLPERVKVSLALLFGVVTIGLSVPLIVKTDAMHIVVLSLIIGTFIGELLGLESGLERFLKRVMGRFAEGESEESQVYFAQYITLIALFCFGSMGVFGAFSEGITHTPDVLLIKATLDFFTAMIFASQLGVAIAFIALPQFIMLAAIYLSAAQLAPFISEMMLNDFSACGGIIFIATGFRMCDIKRFAIINMMPALLVVLLLSRLWEQFG